MAHINLLPWREQLREQQKKNYLTTLAGVAILVFALVYGVGAIFDSLIDNQNTRNQFLEQRISALDAQIHEIKQVKEAKKSIEQKMSLIKQLQTSRNVAPIIMDELARLVPAGISFTAFNRKENRLEISGISESNNRLAAFMRQLDESTVFNKGELSSIVADTSATDAVSDYKLNFDISEKVAPKFIEFDKDKEKKK